MEKRELKIYAKHREQYLSHSNSSPNWQY
uniref:Uncharacterized protein n=1 Tax=Microcebus murinus TaxID=30608 RepID=A0A8C5Y1K5_MICMU